MELDKLKQELNEVAEVASKITGVHVRVAKKIGFSTVYCNKVRAGLCANKPTKENGIILQKMIDAYKKEMEDYVDEINELEHKATA